MRKYLSQIIGEATERLPKQNQVIGNYWSTTIMIILVEKLQ